MIYQIEDVVKDIRVALDTNNSSEALAALEDVDTLTMEEIVRSKVLDAVERVHSEAPVHLLEEGHTFGDAVYWQEMESGWVLLPDDFMRLMVFEMSDWERPVFTAISGTDPRYLLQSSRHKGLRGTSQKPVCAIVNRQEGKVLEFYSCKSEDAYVRRAQYMPYPRIDEMGGVDISRRCYRAVVYTAAALVTTAIGEADKTETLLGLAKTSMQ